jgi:hypothetical protein
MISKYDENHEKRENALIEKNQIPFLHTFLPSSISNKHEKLFILSKIR